MKKLILALAIAGLVAGCSSSRSARGGSDTDNNTPATGSGASYSNTNGPINNNDMQK